MSLAEGEIRGEITEQSLSRLLERKDVERTRPGAMQRDFLTPSRWAEGDLAKANFVVTSEMNERLARGIGDMNLLFLDPAYARKSPFGRKITPPSMMAYAENVNGAVDGFPGCHAIWRGLEFEWEELIYTDEPILSSSRLIDAKIVDSKFAGGMAGIQSYETRIENLDGQSKGVYRTHWHRFSRKKAASSGKYKKTEEKHWTDEELNAIWEEYRQYNFNRRTSEALYVEDVDVGQDIPHIVKGPINLTSKLAFEFARGAGGWFVGHELAVELFEQYPNLAFRNEENVPEPPVAIHWTNERCQKYLGMPKAYEAGYERINWLAQMAMSWMGDHGRMVKMGLQFHGFHWQGDAIRMHGKVTAKDETTGMVDLDIRTVTHRGEDTCTGTMRVKLPVRQGSQ